MRKSIVGISVLVVVALFVLIPGYLSQPEAADGREVVLLDCFAPVTATNCQICVSRLSTAGGEFDFDIDTAGNTTECADAISQILAVPGFNMNKMMASTTSSSLLNSVTRYTFTR